MSKARTAMCRAMTVGLLLSVCAQAGFPQQSPARPGIAPPTSGDPAHGRVVYQACESCHSVDEDDVGPRHRGVYGRKAGSVPGYAYSAALKRSGIVWTAKTLDQWLTGPQAMVPGSKMFFSLKSASDRADVIAYLATLTATTKSAP
jgi:cytochrome c